MPKPLSARPLRSFLRVSGALHRARSSASFLKNSGSLPNKSSMNCCAEIGVPSGCQNVVLTMLWILRSFPSASFTLIFLRFSYRAGGLFLPRRRLRRRQLLGLWPLLALRFNRFAVPLRIVEMVVRLHEIVDREIVLAIVEPCPRPMICLNSIIELIGRIRTILRIFRASTPVESFCDVVRIVGIVFSLS